MSETENGGGTAIAVRPAELANQRLEGGLTEGNSVMAPADWQMLAAIAETVKATEFVPAGLRGNGPKVLACMLYGHSLGIHPMVSLKEIAVIDGTPSMSAALMVAKVRERGHTMRREELWEDDEQAVGGRLMVGVTAHGTRADTGETDSYTFTIAMARRAGLMGKKNWQSYPEAMLWHRASSQLCTFLFPDVFMGSPYMPEELGADGADAGIPSDVDVHIAAYQEAGGLEAEGAPVEAIEAEIAAHAEAAVSPQEPEPVEATVEPPEQPAAPETPVEPRPGPSVTLLFEGLWTPLDERDPTPEEYAACKALIAGELYVDDIGDDDLEEKLAAAQTLVEAFEAAIPTDEELVAEPSEPETAETVAGVSVKGTAVEVMLRASAAAERDDLSQLGAMLELEKAQSRPRIRVVAGLEGAIAEVRERTSTQPELTPPEGEAPAPAVAFQPEASEEAPVVHPLDPATPFDELTPELAAARVKALLAVIADQEPNPQWTYPSVMTSASKIWQIEARGLEDFGLENLESIYSAAPEVSRRMLEAMKGEHVEQMAAMVPGGDEA